MCSVRGYLLANTRAMFAMLPAHAFQFHYNSEGAPGHSPAVHCLQSFRGLMVLIVMFPWHGKFFGTNKSVGPEASDY